jgi:PAS domain S-box-containing protein
MHKPFDICILDYKSFDVNKDSLQRLKDQSAPIFLPFLLLSQDQDRVRNNNQILDFADDVVYIPASTKMLQSRINMLLKQREYSLKLEEQNKKLEQKNQQLSDEKRKYELLAENASDMISRHKPDGTYLYVSPASKELIGYTPDELVGENAYNNMHPDDRERLVNDNTPFTADSTVRWEFRKQTKNGSYKWVESTMRPIRDAAGELVEIQATTRDISSRKEYEEKLEEEKGFIDSAIKSMPELFFLIDDNQRFVRWNNVDRELGYSDEEVNEMHPLDFYHEKDQAFIISKIHQAFNEGTAEAEVEMKHKDGHLVPYYVTAKRFTRGNQQFIVGSCINLSDIKEAQFELQQNRQLLDAIINQTEAIIYVKDSEGRNRLVNKSYCRLFSLEHEEIIGKTDREIHGDMIADNVAGFDRQVLEEEKVLEVEEEIPIDGEMRYYHSIKYPLEGVPGFENCMCGVSTEITEKKKVLQQLQERIKEQRCLYNVSKVDEEDRDVEEVLQKAVQYLAEGFQYPDITEAAITFDGKQYKTEGYRSTDWQLNAKQNQIEDIPLDITIVYTEFRKVFGDQAFLEEEKKLIDSISDTLASKIDRIYARRKLRDSKDRWKKLVNNDPDLIQITRPDGTIEFINPAGARMFGKTHPDELIGQKFADVVDFDQREIAEKRTQILLSGESVPPKVFKMTTSGGTERFLKVQSVLTTLENGEKGIQNVAEDITDRVNYEKKLEESLTEKETLLQEIHHRVKNNLAVVSGMMELQTFNTDNEEVRSTLADSKNRIKTMALIHEKLYQSESLSHIDFGNYVEDLLENIKKVTPSSDKITLNLNYDSFSLNVNQAVPTALIINEVVSNSFEHAFTDLDKGTVEVDIDKDGTNVAITIRDNGSGINEDFYTRKRESMGFTIVDTLIQQLNADKQTENKDGFCFSFSFEKQEIKGSSSSLV